MKKFITLLLVLTGMVSTASATTVKIKGSWDNWKEYTLENTSGNIYSISLTFTEKSNIEFGIDVDGAFYKNNGTMTWDNCSNWTFSTSESNCHIRTVDTGSYTFVWDNATKKLSVTYPEYETETVYFCNNHSWEYTPIVYLLGTSYWDDSKGSGSYGRNPGSAMSKIGSTNIWKLEYPKTLGSQYIAFVKNRQDGYGNFENTEAVYMKDFNSSKPLYVPNTTDPINKNYTDENKKWTAYWNTGEWHAYPTYTRLTTEGKFGTICLPFAATVTGATVYSLDSKVMDGSNLKGVNLTVVVNLEAGKSYIFKATGTTLTATYSGSYSDAIAGAMVGNLSSNTKDVPEGDYIIYNNSITKAGTGVTIGQYRGYIDISEVPEASALSKDFIAVDGEEETDGINSVHGVELNSSEMYNLSGQKVSSNYKGIVIQNGKKLINK